MKKHPSFTLIMVLVFMSIFLFTSAGQALEIVLKPANAQRKIDQKVRVQIYANNCVDLISMGIKVSFDPLLLQVENASKWEDFDTGWIMDEVKMVVLKFRTSSSKVFRALPRRVLSSR